MRGLQQKSARLFLAILLFLPLFGCQTVTPAPVVEREQPPTEKILRHIVSPGETLYSIAWRYELDFQQLARVNGLGEPYDVYPGQKLSLDMSKSPVNPQAGSSAKPGGVTAYPVESGEKPAPSRPSTSESSPAKPPAASPPPVTVPEAPPLPGDGWSWQWPARGQVTREYDVSNVLKGISIYTGSGESVLSAAPGVVVYAGEGLRGYGRLIIVKHSNKYLSAYAHNHRILVNENDSVRQGQQIAEAGKDNSGRHRLYFEIRENGKPVDPLKLLPK